MTQSVLYGLVGVGLFCLALHSLLTSRHLLRKLIAANVMGSGVFAVFVATARRGPGVDPVPHAMVLTGIVVAVAATGLGVVLLRRLQDQHDRSVLPEDAAPGDDGEPGGDEP